MSTIPFPLLGENPTNAEFVAMLRMLADAIEQKGLGITSISYSVERTGASALPTARLEMAVEGTESMPSIKIERVP